MAEKRTIDIKINNNAEEAAKDFNHFNDALDETAKSAKNVNSTFEEVYGELQPLTTRLGEAEDRLYELAIAGDTTSKEYQELLTKVGEYRKVQIQTDLVVDSAATTMGQKLGGALSGATSGFAAVQGVMALVGGESEALEKTLVKVQAALAIQQGVQGIREAIPSIKQLGTAAVAAFKGMTAGAKAFAATGLGLIITTIAIVISEIKRVDEEEETLAKNRDKRERDRLAKFFDSELESARIIKESAQRDAYDLALKKAQAKSRQKIYELEKEQIKDNIESANTALKFYDKAIARLEKKRKAAAKAGQEESFKLLREQVALAKKERDQALAIKLETNNKLKILEIEYNKESNERYKEYLKERKSIARQIEDLENELLEDGLEKELEINRDKFRRLREDTEKNTKLTRDERKKIIDLYDKQELAQQKVINQKYIDLEKEKNKKIDDERDRLNQERIDKEDALFLLQLEADDDQLGIEIANLQKAYEEKYKLAEDNAQLVNDLYDKQLKDEEAIREKYRKEKEAKDKEASDKEKADALATQQAKIQFANDALGAIGELANAFAGDSEKSQRRAFKINKAVGLAQAIINTAGAVSAAINPAVGGLGIPAGLPGAILAAATGAAQIATIAKTKFEGGSTGDVSAPNESGLGAVQAPEFNVVGDSSVNQLAQLQQTPTQAFVVSGDVTSAQALDRNRVTNATL